MKREYTVIIVLFLLILALLVIAGPFFKTTSDLSDVKSFVIEDLKTTYPNAEIEIISTKEKTTDNGGQYYEIKAKVIKGQGTACPERTHIYYNYPEQNFVPKTPEQVTSNCKVSCTEGTCNLVFPEEAIIASHTITGTEDVHTYLMAHPDMKATATETASGWAVTWISSDGMSNIEVQLSKSGTMLSVKQIFSSFVANQS